MGEKGTILKDVAKGSLLGRHDDSAFAIKIGNAFKRDMPTLWIQQTCQQPQYRTFARATLAQQDRCFSLLSRKTQFQMKCIKPRIQPCLQHVLSVAYRQHPHNALGSIEKISRFTQAALQTLLTFS